MRNKIQKKCYAAILFGFAAVLLYAAAQAQTPTLVTNCGQTLSKPGVYVLNSTLDCSGTHANGVTITASNVTFHLAGYTLSSTDCDKTKDINGIFVPGGISRVRIDSGTVRGFNDGIVLSSSSSRVSGMTVAGACAFGIAVQGDHNRVDTSSITSSGLDGIGFQFATHILIAENDIFDNTGFGIGFSENSNNNVIKGNIISHNGILTGHAGIGIGSGTDNLVVNNAIRHNFDGIRVEDVGNMVRDNTVTGSSGVGIYIPGSGSPSTVMHNVVYRSSVADMSDASVGCGANTWRNDAFQTDLVAAVPDGGPGVGCIQ